MLLIDHSLLSNVFFLRGAIFFNNFLKNGMSESDLLKINIGVGSL